jgi:hypothetical protein
MENGIEFRVMLTYNFCENLTCFDKATVSFRQILREKECFVMSEKFDFISVLFIVFSSTDVVNFV